MGRFPLRATIAATWMLFPEAATHLQVLAVFPTLADVPDDGVARMLLAPDGADASGPVYQIAMATAYVELGGGDA